MLGGEDRGQDIAAAGRERVTMRGIDFANEAVSAEHAQEPGDAGAAAMFFFDGIRRSVVEEALQVTVAKAVDGELAAADEFKELGVFRRPRTQSADAFAAPLGGLRD